MIVFELDIPLLTQNGIQMRGTFSLANELVCSSKID